MKKCYWEHFEHKADIGIRGIAPSLSQAFEQAAIAMTAVITDPRCVNTIADITVECAAVDNEILFLDWLNNLIYEMSVRKMLFSQFKVTIDKGKLTALVSGENIDVAKHQPAVEIKGATFTELEVNQQENGLWVAQCVVDV